MELCQECGDQVGKVESEAMTLKAFLWLVVFVLAFSVAAAQALISATEPATPVNLQATNITPTSITLLFGPSEPGPFKVISSTRNSVTVQWGASTDSRGPVVYMIQRNGQIVASNYIGTNRLFKVSGKQSSFRVCVQASTGSLKSAFGCSTISRT